MPLAPGTLLGPYSVSALIGRGGMGEVYKAHDTRLRRDVAIKTSAQRFSARFELEARAIAALNHPNICQIYDVGPDYIVMELVEGPTLGERIKEGAIPLEEAESIALQVALALEAAHEKKITHRDLKPGNIKVKPDGVVKVLDFGLAKVGHTPRAETTAGTDESPTLTMSMALTEAGMILGTAAYMAPEQAKGKPVDHRADIWAFGVVLHEMLTGKRLFTGEDLADVLASVVKDQPDLTVVPTRVRKLLQACLQKDPNKRLQSIGDAKLLLMDEEVVAPPVEVKPRPMWPAWAAAGLMAAVAAGAITMWAPWRAAPEEKLLHVTITPPQATRLTGGAYSGISPDGRKLFVELRQENQSRLWVRSLDSNTFQPLPGTDLARVPFWSPDSRFIGFFNEGKLKVVPAGGGPAQELCSETGLGDLGTWNGDGIVLFGSEVGPLRKVKVVNGAAEGACTVVTKPEPGVTRESLPEFLPDGNHFFYLTGPAGQRHVYLAALNDPKPRMMLADSAGVVYAPPAKGAKLGHLLFLRDITLMAQPFDEAALAAVGDPFAVVSPASGTSTLPQVAASVTADGMLLYMAAPSPDVQLTWFDRDGKPVGKAGQRADQEALSLSPDGKKATTSLRGNRETRLFDLSRGTESRYDARVLQSLVWSPDGGHVAYFVKDRIYRANSLGGEEEELLAGSSPIAPSQWTKDGRYLFYTENHPKTRGDIWYLPLAPAEGGKPGQPVKFLATDGVESQAQLSPDGRWVAYTSNETGRDEV